MRLICFVICNLLFFSCIPYRIAPQVDTYKLINGRRFIKKSKTNSFVFIDPKQADEFRQFITIKLTSTPPWEQPFPYWEDQQFLFTINKDSFYLCYYEAYKTTKTIRDKVLLKYLTFANQMY